MEMKLGKTIEPESDSGFNKKREGSMKNKKKYLAEFIIAVAGIFLSLYGLLLFNRHVLILLPLAGRMAALIISQWLLFLVPGILMLIQKEKLRDLGFSGKNLPGQILTGIVLALAMSLVLTVLPILAGLKDMVGSTSYTQAWQFLYEFFYKILGVALAEELIFRGYLFRKLLQIRDSKWFAIGISSALFGILHIFSGNLIQVFLTGLIGLLYCVCRERFKNCTLLSLIIAHGVYDALIILWCGILPF